VRLVQPVDHQQIGDREAQRLLPRTRERQLGRGIELGHAPVRIQPDDALEGRVHDRALARLAGAHVALGVAVADELADQAADPRQQRHQLLVGLAHA
jgi:hypothetical protein